MKIILSRKGFDDTNGGTPSPILSDGTMISFPVPQGFNGVPYTDLYYKNQSYQDLWKQLKVTQTVFRKGCHLDPDLISDNRREVPANWKPVFGMVDAPQDYLAEHEVAVGDVFVFFGMFRKTEDKDDEIRYKRGSAELLAPFGYLQIGAIVKGKDVEQYPWHPHAAYFEEDEDTNNTMYVASDALVINGKKTKLKGAGMLKFSEELLMTLPNANKTQWELADFFKAVTSEGALEAKPLPNRVGNEFVLEEDAKANEWMIKQILANAQ